MNALKLDDFTVAGHEPRVVYPYDDRAGIAVGAVARFEAGTLDPDKKSFIQFRFEEGRYQCGMDGQKLPVFAWTEVVAHRDCPLVIVEGEKCAMALWRRGVPATTLPGGANGVDAWFATNPESIDALQGRELIVLSDNDDTGRRYERDLCEQLLQIDCRVFRLPSPPWDELGKGADVADWLETEHRSDEDIESLFATCVQWTPDAKQTGSTTPAFHLNDDHPVLSEEALCGVAGDFVRMAEGTTEGSSAGVLFGFLTLVGATLGADNDAPHVKVGADKHHGRLFVCLVGPTGSGRKGSAWAPVRALKDALADLDAAADDQHLPSFEIPPDSLAVLKKPVTPLFHEGGLSSGEGIIFHIRDQSVVPAKKEGQKPVVDEGQPDKRLLIYQPEFGGALRMSKRDGNTLADQLRCGWDGTTLAPLIKKDFIKATRPHLCVFGNVTSEELTEKTTRNSFFNGFVNRFLWVAVQREAYIPIPKLLDRAKLDTLAQRVRASVMRARGKTYPLSVAAKAEWYCIYRMLEDRPLSGFAAKATERASPYVLRMALIFAILDDEDCIEPRHLASAVAVWQYAQDSAAYIFGSESNGLSPYAEKVYDFISKSRGEVLKKDVWEAIGKHWNKRRMDNAIDDLCAMGIVEAESQPTGGRPGQVLRIVKKID